MAPSTAAPAAMTTSIGPALASPAARRPSAAKPAPRRRIEPVIPLTFLHRRQNTPTASTQLPPSPLRTSQNTPPTPKQNSEGRHQPTPQLAPQPEPEPAPESEPVEAVADGTMLADDASASPPQEPEQQEEAGVKTVEAGSPPREGSQPDTAGSQAQGKASPSQTPRETTPPDTAPSAPSPASSAPPISSPSPPDNTEPSLYPANNHPAHPQGPLPEHMNLPTHPLDQSRMHQHHPSNGSLVFGGLEGSNTTSPMPHPGDAFLPPPPPPIPMAPDHIPVTGVGAHGRPVLTPAPIDVHAPMMMSHGPLTPHSLHGSHSSRAEDFGPKVLPINGVNGAGVGGRPVLPPAPARHPYHPSNQAPFSPDGFGAGGDAMAFSEYVSSMFARPEFADCEVVLALPDYLTSTNSRFPGVQNGPLRLPAHRLVLSQHHLLRDMIQEQARLGDGPCEVRIESDDPFLRADGMWRAIKYLYGCRYVPLPHHLEAQPDAEKFHTALGYAAAGARLQVPAVSISAVQEASKLLSWDTVEKGLEFALTGLQAQRPMHGPHNFLAFRFKHGVYVGDFVEKIVLFLITCFPANFALDTTVGDPAYARLPALSATPQDPSRAAAGPSANGGHGGSRMSNINIKFGDMDLTEANGHDRPHHPAQQSGQIRAALSRMLLNLPFEMLRLVLETNGIGERNLGWQTAQERRLIMPEVIAEREARRLRSAGELLAGHYQGHVPIDQLRSKTAQPLELPWGNVCWKEECVPYGGDVFSMDRRWVPLGNAF